MQTRGGCGDGDLARLVGIDGLVAGEVLGASRIVGARNVGRQGDVAEAIGHVGDRFIAGRGQAHERGAVVVFGDNFSAEGAVGVGESGADREFFAWSHQAPPHALTIGRTKQKTLDLSAGRPASVEARRQDGGVVAKKEVTRAEELREVGKRMVRDGVRRTIHDEETGLVAASGGRLCDQVRRESVVEEIGGEWWHGRGESHESDLGGRGENLSCGGAHTIARRTARRCESATGWAWTVA